MSKQQLLVNTSTNSKTNVVFSRLGDSDDFQSVSKAPDKIHSRTNLLSHRAQTRKFWKTLAKSTPLLIIGAALVVFGSFIAVADGSDQKHWHFLSLHDVTWILWFGFSLILIPLNKILVHTLFNILLRITYFDPKKYYKSTKRKMKLGDTLDVFDFDAQTRHGQWQTLFYFVPIERLFRRVLFFTMSFLIWIFFINLFDNSANISGGEDVARSKGHFVNLWRLLTFQDGHDDGDYDEYDVLLVFYRVFLCCLLAAYVLFFENIIVRGVTAGVYLSQYFNHLEKLTKMERLLCSLMNRKHIFTPNLTNFLVTYPSHPKPSRYFETSHINSFCLCCEAGTMTGDHDEAEDEYAAKQEKRAQKMKTGRKKDDNNDGNDEDDDDDVKIEMERRDTVDMVLSGTGDERDRDRRKRRVYIRNDSKRPKFNHFSEFSLDAEQNSCPQAGFYQRNSNNSNNRKDTAGTAMESVENENSNNNSNNNDNDDDENDPFGNNSNYTFDSDIHCPLWSYSPLKMKATKIDQETIVNLSRLYGNIIYNNVAKHINESEDNYITEADLLGDSNNSNNKNNNNGSENNKSFAGQMTHKMSQLNIATMFRGLTARGKASSNRFSFSSQTQTSTQSRLHRAFSSSSMGTEDSEEVGGIRFDGDHDGSNHDITGMTGISEDGVIGNGNSNGNRNGHVDINDINDDRDLIEKKIKYPQIRNYLMASDFRQVFVDNHEVSRSGERLFDMFDVTKTGRISCEEIEQSIATFFQSVLNARSQFDSYKHILNSLQNAGAFYTHFILVFFYLIIFDFDFSDALSIYASLLVIGIYFGSNPISTVIDGVTLIFILQPYNVGDVIQLPGDENQYTIDKITYVFVVFNIHCTLLYFYSVLFCACCLYDLFICLFFLFVCLIDIMCCIVNCVMVRLNTTTMTSAFGIQSVWYNTDLLSSQLTGITNLSQTINPYHKIFFYINYDTSEEQIDKFEAQFRRYIRHELKGICSHKFFLIVASLDLFMKGQVLLMVPSYIPFSNIGVRWGTHSKLYRGVRKICKQLGIKSTFNPDNLRAAAAVGLVPSEMN